MNYLNYFYVVSVALLPKSEIAHTHTHSHRPISLKNINEVKLFTNTSPAHLKNNT